MAAQGLRGLPPVIIEAWAEGKRGAEVTELANRSLADSEEAERLLIAKKVRRQPPPPPSP